MEHELKYRAGTAGLGHVGIPDDVAHWYCSCEQWRLTARPMSHRQTGNNKIEAEKAHGLHAHAAHLVDTDFVDSYQEGLRVARKIRSEG